MNKIYLLIVIGAALCGTYFYGADIATAKCNARIANQNLQMLQNIQNQIMENKRKNHEMAYKTRTDDVRRILRDKYTIAE